jgi:hypothetical protein
MLVAVVAGARARIAVENEDVHPESEIFPIWALQ